MSVSWPKPDWFSVGQYILSQKANMAGALTSLSRLEYMEHYGRHVEVVSVVVEVPFPVSPRFTEICFRKLR